MSHAASYSGKTILVTGASGVVAAALLRHLVMFHCKIICQYNKQTPKLDGYSEFVAEVVCVQGDLRDENFWENLLPGVDLVFHLAAQTSAYHANKHPSDDLILNLMPIARFLETAEKRHFRPVLINAGTVTQVGLTYQGPVDETALDCPETIYDIDKLAGEHYVRCYGQRMGGMSVTLRLANVYGPAPNNSQAERGLTNRMICLALEGKSLLVYGSGSQVRDYIYVDDVAMAFVYAGACIEHINGRHFVIGSGKGCTIYEMATAVSHVVGEIKGHRVTVENIQEPEGMLAIEKRHFVANTRAYFHYTGWQPRWSLAQGLYETACYYQSMDRI